MTSVVHSILVIVKYIYLFFTERKSFLFYICVIPYIDYFLNYIWKSKLHNIFTSVQQSFPDTIFI